MVTPDIGIIFWTTVSFLIVLFILGKYAWKPIMNSINERENEIEEALEKAGKARREMAALKQDKEEMMKEARQDREKILKEAREIKESILNEAKNEAKKEAGKVMQEARETIKNEKNAAVGEIKNQVAALSVEIAEKILKSELSSEEKQKAIVDNMLKDVNMN